MRWARGFVRLWVAISVLWIGAVVWAGYEAVLVPRNKAMQVQACFEERRLNAAKGNPFDCLDGNTVPAPPAGFVAQRPFYFDDQISLSAHAGYIWAGIGPPVALLAFGVIVAWIVGGFRRSL